jgi:hypothetical protein
MSTRCQVQVIEINGSQNSSKITLYHHTDGYPEYMIPKIFEAYCYEDSDHGNEGWIKGRAGKVAGLLCWADPGVFEPEDHHRLHSDIDYYYRLFCNYSNDIKNVIWEIEIYKRDWGVDELDINLPHDQLLDKLYKRTERLFSGIKNDDFKLIQERQSIVDLVKKYNMNNF